MASPEKEAFEMIPETCPLIDRGASDFKRDIEEAISSRLDDFIEKVVKEQTGALRNALVEAIRDKQEQEGRADRLEHEVKDLEKEVARLNREYAILESSI